ncbi:MAG: TonB-dependent receptor [Bacteroidales bacterium]|jgi:TonB-linked SusC/RagA family outer membrane protein|nr:TonB-dependent receptor [Bacteroidales bacterium]
MKILSKTLKYVGFLACMGIFAGSAEANAQARKVSLTYKDVPLKTILKEIETQSEYSFVYSDEIDLDKTVTLQIADLDIDEALKTLFAAAGLSYRITDTYVILYVPETTSSKQEVRQNIRIRGAVTDENGDPVPGVNITVKGTTTGVITDANGKYSVIVPNPDAVLVFSFVGYASQEIIAGDRTDINVTMSEDATEIEEVVVVGYGVQKKESSVASIVQVKGDELVKMGATNISQALTGQIQGVSTVQRSGKPGDDLATVFIRGVSSWVSNTPLVLVDGVERNYNHIDPNEIESLSVLKDASATAVFGVRGANGVILITTKRGKKGEVKVNASAEVTMKQPINMNAPMDSYTTALVLNEAVKNDNNFGSVLSDEILEHYRLQDLPYMYPNTNWQKELLKKAGFAHQYNINVAGGTEFTRVFASLSYLYDGDIIKKDVHPLYDPTNKFNRYNYRFNIDADVTKSTVFSLDAGGYISFINMPYETNAQRLYRPLFVMGPMQIPKMYPAEALEIYPDLARPDETGERLASSGQVNTENPHIANSYSGSRQVKRTDINVTARVKQELDFITKGLSLNVKVAFKNDVRYAKNYSYDAVSYKLNADGTWTRYKGRAATIDGETPATPVNVEEENISEGPHRTWDYEASLNYARQFGIHEVTGLVLAQRRQRVTNAEFPRYDEGIIGRVTYDYDLRYLLELNMAYNGSEQFAPQNRYGFFPSYAVGWNLHHEKFFEPVKKWVSRAKIRASYGEVGSDAANSRWLYTSSWVNDAASGDGTIKYRPGTETSTGATVTGIVEENAANSNATWERAVKQDLGFELSFLKNNLFVVNVELFKEHRTGILLDRQSVPAWFGVGMKQQNLGETETKGYEIDVKFQYTTAGHFYYFVKPGVSFSDNRILERDEPMDKPDYQKEKGHRIFQPFGLHAEGWIQDADELMTSDRLGAGLMGLGDTKWTDYNGDAIIDDNDRVAIGYAKEYPLYNYSLSGGFRYKNLQFDFLFQGVSHFSKRLNDPYAWPLHRLSNHVFDYQMDAWSPDNRDAAYPAFHIDANRLHNDGGEQRSNSLYDCSYIRLKQVSLSYTVPQRWSQKMRLQSLSFYLRGNNIFTWAPNFPLADPEAADGDGGNLNNSYYPMTRRMSLGLQVSF